MHRTNTSSFPQDLYTITLNVGIHSGSGSACTRDRTEIVMVWCRAVGRSENTGVPVNLVGLIFPTLVEIGLTDLPKSGGPWPSLPPPAPTGLDSEERRSGACSVLSTGKPN